MCAEMLRGQTLKLGTYICSRPTNTLCAIGELLESTFSVKDEEGVTLTGCFFLETCGRPKILTVLRFARSYIVFSPCTLDRSYAVTLRNFGACYFGGVRSH